MAFQIRMNRSMLTVKDQSGKSRTLGDDRGPFLLYFENPGVQTDVDRMFPKIFPGAHILHFYTVAMLKSVILIYRSHYKSVIARSGRGPRLLRILSSLQKLLCSQERDGRLNNKFPITVTI